MSDTPPRQNVTLANTQVLGYARTEPPPAIAVFLCRVLALGMLAWGLYSATLFIAYLCVALFQRDLAGSVATALFYGLPPAIWLSLAWYYWKKAPRLAGRIARGVEVDTTSQSLNPDDLLRVLLIGVGVFLLTEGLPIVVSILARAVTNQRAFQGPGNVFRVADLNEIARIILGTWLVLRPDGAAGLINRYSRKTRGAEEYKPETSDFPTGTAN
jgi:hypothetical protein